MSVIQFPLRPTLDARFFRARQEMLAAILEMVRTGSDAVGVADEIDGTIAALAQIRDLQPILAEKSK